MIPQRTNEPALEKDFGYLLLLAIGILGIIGFSDRPFIDHLTRYNSLVEFAIHSIEVDVEHSDCLLVS